MLSQSPRLCQQTSSNFPNLDYHHLGRSFLTVKYGLTFSSPLIFVALRFAAATLAVTCFHGNTSKANFIAVEVFAGFCIGAVIAIGAWHAKRLAYKVLVAVNLLFLTGTVCATGAHFTAGFALSTVHTM